MRKIAKLSFIIFWVKPRFVLSSKLSVLLGGAPVFKTGWLPAKKKQLEKRATNNKSNFVFH
jgi:hypothetical protein